MADDPTAKTLALIDAGRARSRRVVIGIAGAPGSGKSTFAAKIAATLSQRGGAHRVAVLPMDGFHLDNDELKARGLLDVKGAPETFDVEAFAAMLEKVRNDGGALRYPLFDRAMDRTIPDAGYLDGAAEIVVVEGNYLLLQRGPWSSLADLLDKTIMLSVPMTKLRGRLVERWLEHGLSPEAAALRTDSNDMANARTVVEQSAPADLTLVFEDGLRSQENTPEGDRNWPG